VLPVLPRTSDQPSLPGPSLVPSVGERELLPALALEEGAVGLQYLYLERPDLGLIGHGNLHVC
jgi:hypothetical protein